jgi:hypothetical protein
MPNLHDAAKMSQFRLAMSYAGGGSMIITLAKLNVFSLLSAVS